MDVLTTPGGQLAGSIGARFADILGRSVARAKRYILRSCHPIARSLGMSDGPWGALWWIVVAAVLTILSVITFFRVEGSMWT